MSPPYRVVYPERVKAAIRNLCAKALQRGLRQRVSAALRAIDQRLHADPRTYGEAKYCHHALKLESRVAITFVLRRDLATPGRVATSHSRVAL